MINNEEKSSKYCTKCGKEIEIDTKFCPYCGQMVPEEIEKKAKKRGRKKVIKEDIVEEKKEELIKADNETPSFLDINKSNLKDLMAPSGIDATHYDYLEIFSKISARFC